MMTVKLICVGKMKEKFFVDAFNEYAKRLGGYCRFECIEIPESSLDKEADNVLKYYDKGAYVTALAIEGKKLSSTEFAARISELAISGVSELIFVIGGSLGLSERIKNNADFRLSMSDMTFPHHLARVMVAEQIYRAFKINEGSAYHK